VELYPTSPLSFHGFYRENFNPIVLPHFSPILKPLLATLRRLFCYVFVKYGPLLIH